MHPTHTLPINEAEPTRHVDGQPETPVLTPASTLRATARYLDRHGWCQGSYYDQTATCFTPAACLVGALGMVCYGGPVDAPALNYDDPGWNEFDKAIGYLDRWFKTRLSTDVYTFNDTRTRIADEVIAALRSAADEYEGRQRSRDPMDHADYPHHPGTLYDCPGCEAACFCDDGSTPGFQCVHCAIAAESQPPMPTNGGGA